jgi:hypothetical protein
MSAAAVLAALITLSAPSISRAQPAPLQPPSSGLTYGPAPNYGPNPIGPAPAGYSPFPFAPFAPDAGPAPPLPYFIEVRRGEAMPAGYHLGGRARRELVIGGLVAFGALYAIGAIDAWTTHNFGSSELDFLYAPIVGPFAAIPKVKSTGARVLLALDGLGQTAGVTLAIVGALWLRPVYIRNDLALRVNPIFGRGVEGLVVEGTL